MMTPLELARTRYTTKHYDATKVIPEAQIDELAEILRLAPTAVNAQPCHFYIVSGAAKDRLLPAFPEFNHPRITGASHVVIFTVHRMIDETHLQAVAAKEEADGRFGAASPETRASRAEHCARYVNTFASDEEKLFNWTSRQAYLAVGQLVDAACQMGIDSTIIEGVMPAEIDRLLDLQARGLRTVLCVSLGYRAADDSNARRPKSRLAMDQVVTRLS